MHIQLKTGNQCETSIEKIAFGGEGVGRIGGLVIFIPFSAEGDHLRVQITSVKKNYLRGRIVEILDPSDFRTQPNCRHFARCGGCHYQHILYDRQLQIKKGQVIDAYGRIGRLASIPIQDCIASGNGYGYRGKAEFHAGFERNGALTLGFMAAESNRVVDIDRCEILEESINKAYSSLRSRLAKGRKPSDEELIFWSDQEPRAPQGRQANPAPGIKTVSRQVKGRSFLAPYSGFFQANIQLIDRLVDTVMDCGHLSGSETVLDIFSGSGLFSLFAAERSRRVFGVEIDAEAVSCASLNARAFGCSNATFLQGSAEDILRNFKTEGIKPDLSIIDPPRTGCDPPVLSGMIELTPERIVYVSCDPATQARDIARLVQNGYSLESVQPIDMFPQTKHIEVIASLRKDGSGTP